MSTAYVYPGDTIQLEAAIAKQSRPVNIKLVRQIEPYRKLTHLLASASSNPANAAEILAEVAPHLAALEVALAAARDVVIEVCVSLGVDLEVVGAGPAPATTTEPLPEVVPGPGPVPAPPLED